MIKILIGSLFTALVIILIVLGLVNYNSRYSDTPDKDKFSFLNQFPYELQDNPTMKYNLIFKIYSLLILKSLFISIELIIVIPFANINLYAYGLLSLIHLKYLSLLFSFLNFNHPCTILYNSPSLSDASHLITLGHKSKTITMS